MSKDELAFVYNNYLGEMKLYYNAMKWIVIVCMSLTMIYLILKQVYYNPEENLDPPNYAYWIIGIMAFLMLLLILSSYYMVIHKHYKDAKEGQKIIEFCQIKEKWQVNGNCMLALNSIFFNQIQITPADYDRYNAGDEINIEYALHSKYYFGYF